MNDVDLETAVPILTNARRIMVIGSSGSGKSTLSAKLAGCFDLPYISMDKEFFWLSGWVGRPQQEQRDMIAQAAGEECWLMDGSNSSTFDLRVPRADAIIWLRLPRLFCLWSILRRVCKSFGGVRPDMAEGCPEQLPDLEFIRYIWTFEKVHAPLIIKRIELYGPNVPVLTLKSRSQSNRLLDLVVAAA
jgi:adenylate kinase family enzyme